MTPTCVGISAYAAVNALGSSTVEVLANLKAGRTGLRPSEWDLPFSTYCGHMPATLPALPSALKAFDTRTTRLAWLALAQVESEVSTAIERWGTSRIGLILGSSTAGMLETEHAFKHFQSYGSLPDDYSILTQHAFHGLVDALASHLGIVGPRYVVSTACSSSAKVFGSALRLMQSDLVDAVLVGGADSLCQITLRGFSSLGILSEHLCRPFGQGRDGINLGEGAALLLLERQEGGIQVRGVGESSDAHHMSAPDPEGKGARMAIMQALQQAGLDGKEVDYVNAHGTGTVLNDHMESRVLLEVCGKDVPVVSTKGYTGHMLGAAGATEAVFVVAALEQGWIPISLGALPLDSNIEIRVNTDSYECFCRHAMSTSFAFGGSNAAVVLSRT